MADPQNPYSKNPYAGVAPAAKYGSTGNRFFDALQPVLGFANGAYQAYATNPRAGGTIIPGLAGLAQQLAAGHYMKQANAWAQQEALRQQQQQLGQENVNYDAYGNSYGGAEVPANAGDSIRENMATPSVNTMLQGGVLQYGPRAKVSDAVVNNYMNRMGATSQDMATMNAINTPQTPQNPVQTPQSLVDPNGSGATMMPIVSNALQAGATVQGLTPTVDYSQQSPFAMLVPKVSEMITSENNRGTLAQTAANNAADNAREDRKFAFEQKKFTQQMGIAREKLKLYAKQLGSQAHNVTMPQLIYNAYQAGKLTDEEYKNAITKPGMMMLFGGGMPQAGGAQSAPMDDSGVGM